MLNIVLYLGITALSAFFAFGSALAYLNDTRLMGPMVGDAWAATLFLFSLAVSAATMITVKDERVFTCGVTFFGNVFLILGLTAASMVPYYLALFCYLMGLSLAITERVVERRHGKLVRS
ncbi:MAG: hypothetical protein HY420_00765 [Candidatus Kerfeldbacteria bacterium]|nr:hypothetical protein [Candidatus Kerfeldbacteria bacterium]